jgi:hypothetical protein
MSVQNFSSSRKDDETIRIEILCNICRMMVNRGNMDISKYCKDQYKTEDMDFKDINYNLSSMIDDKKFIHYFKDKSEKNIYIIKLDTAFEDERTSNDNFDGLKLVVSIVPQKITDIKNSDIINDVLKTYPQHKKIFVIDSIIEKAFNTLLREKNTEVFTKDDLMIDLMGYNGSPHRCRVNKDANDTYFVKPNMPRMHENDPLARYYNAKVGDIVEIIGNSVTNGFERRYRRVIEPKSVFS